MMATAVALSGLATSCQAAEKNKDVEVTCPSGIDHSTWDRLLKKHVDDKGLVNYARGRTTGRILKRSTAT